MNRTLHAYISRDLVKVTALALVAFTLVMTVFAIIEPLRKRGLASGQVASLFAYTLPMMLSLTVPIAALFAGTIVYGRFSQDNELLACRASGISSLTLLRPALVQALIVTAMSLVLSNLVAPAMAARAGRALKTNIRGIVYGSLRSRNFMESPSGKKDRFILHADRVDPEADRLYGVVLVYMKHTRKDGRPNWERRVATAASTKLLFTEEGDESYIGFDALYVTGGTLGGFDRGEEGRQLVPRHPIEDPIKEKPSWFNWARLVRLIKHPELDKEISKRLSDIRRGLVAERLFRQLAEDVNSGKSFELSGSGRSYVISAARVALGGDGTAKLSSSATRPVCVLSWNDDPRLQAAPQAFCLAIPLPAPAACALAADVSAGSSLPEVVLASAGEMKVKDEDSGSLLLLEGGRSTGRDAKAGRDSPDIRIRLTDGVTAVRPWSVPLRRSAWSCDVADAGALAPGVGEVSLHNLSGKLEELKAGKSIRREANGLLNSILPALRGKLIGEMHGRIAYGASCFLLVAIGAALGLIFRGGQIISAFATSAVPAAGVIVLVLMGKELARNSQVPLAAGLAVIWSGVAALGAACAVVYLYLSRK